MANKLWQDSLDKQVREELERLLLIVQSAVVALQIWEQVLTENQRRRLGGDLKEVLKTRRPIEIWRHLYNVSQPRAIIEIARNIGLIDETRERWLLRGIGDHARRKATFAPPSWDAAVKELRLRGKTIRKVRVAKHPTNVQRILDAIEAAGWPVEIPNPFRDYPRKTTDQAVNQLNKGLLAIRFHCAEGAQTLGWQLQVKSKSTRLAS